MSYLNVRYPTGHLEKIPVQPNAPLLRALEAACSKRSFDVQKCKLIYRKKPLDLSVPFRLSGLLNHANVELVISDEQPDNAGSQSEGKPIRVCLRLEDGHRAEWMGSVNTCLWEILESIAASEPKIAQLMTPTEAGLAPTLIYIQQQICGEAFLRSATLSSLGIREGSVLLQLVQRVQTDADLPPSAPPQSVSTSLPANEVERSSAAVDHAQVSQSPPEPAPAPSSTAEATPPIRNHNGESFSLIFPSQTTTQRPTSSSASPFAEPFSIFGARPAKSMFGEPERPQPKQQKIATIGELLGVSLEPDARSQTAFVPEELRDFKFPEETAGQNLFYTDSEETGAAQQDSTPCDRETIICRRVVSESNDVEMSDDVPDEFFELTEGELRRILVRLREEAGTDTPLGASSLQQAARARFYARYPRCIIRFTWPDDVFLQACFRPGEKVSALYDFIKDYLVPTARDFQLYTTPPKVNIPNNSAATLVEANLVPMTKVHLTLPSGPPKAADVLRPQYMASLTTESSAADEIAIKW
ncbi:hypothetical protein AAHC03_022901 [Spirometra sp. Aus1]